MGNMKSNLKISEKGQALIGFTIILVLILLIATFVPQRLAVDNAVSGVVVEKYILQYPDVDYYHVVVMLDNGASEDFENTDAIWWLKGNSRSLQANLIIGQHYTFTATGWRVQWLSWFRNIVIAKVKKSL